MVERGRVTPIALEGASGSGGRTDAQRLRELLLEAGGPS
jgi:thymidylate kinase